MIETIKRSRRAASDFLREYADAIPPVAAGLFLFLAFVLYRAGM